MCYLVLGDFTEMQSERPISASDRQVGGNHYHNNGIQPIHYILANDLGFCEGNVVKYITRYKHKGGIEDLDKVIHYVELLKESLSEEDSID